MNIMKVIENTDYYTEEYVKCLTNKINEVNAEKEQLNSLVNSCQSEIRRLNSILKHLKEYCHEHEEYEITKLIEQLENANIEWLEKD